MDKSRPIDPTKAQLCDYVVVFKDDRPPKESSFQAVSDQHAKGLMETQYPKFAWTLFRLNHGQRKAVHAQPGQEQEQEQESPAAK